MEVSFGRALPVPGMVSICLTCVRAALPCFLSDPGQRGTIYDGGGIRWALPGKIPADVRRVREPFA